MSKKIIIKDEKKFKSMKNSALGSSRVANLEIGDIVSWSSWAWELDQDVFEDKEGLLLEIIEETRLTNIVLIAKIMPFGSNEYEFIPLLSLKKSPKRD
jgi:heme oxygenase